MNFIERGLQNIAANDGFSLSVAGMGIVFLALAVIALIIKVLPYLLFLLDKIVPEKIVEPEVKVRSGKDDGAVIAAIAAAIYKQKQKAG